MDDRRSGDRGARLSGRGGSGPDASALRRDLGLVDAVGVGFGAIVGAGIFVVTGVAAEIAGPALILALVLAAVPATANALSSAQLAASYPRSGGTYEYGYQVLTPTLGFAAGWMFLAAKISAAGTVALGLGGYLEAVIPGVSPRWAAVGALLLFTILNALGVRRTSRVNLVVVAASVGSLVVFVLLGIASFDPGNLRPFAPGGTGSILQATALLFFAYTGYARIATLGEEVREPRRTIPRAIGITMAGAVLLYGAVALVAVGTAGAGALAGSAAPLRAAGEAMGAVGMAVPVVTFGAVTAMLGVILSQVLGLSRMVFAMARRGDLPRILEGVDPVRGVPRSAVLTVGGAAILVAATGTLAATAAAASFTILLYYAIANLAALRMPSEGKLYSDIVPWVGLVGCVLLAFSLPARTIGVGLAILALGVVGRWVVPRGVESDAGFRG